MTDTLKHLTALGLTDYESRAYDALLHQSPLNASEISRITGIPPGKVYSVLDTLVREGFCLVIPGKRKRFSAVCPKAAAGGLIDARRLSQSEWEHQVTAAAEELDRQYETRLENDSTADYVSVYTTPESMKTKFWELCLRSTKAIRVFNKPPYMLGPFASSAQRDKRNHDALLERGLEIRSICEIDRANPSDSLTFAAACGRGGQPVRVSTSLPLKLHIFDRDAVLLTLTDHPFCRRMCYSLLISHTAHANAMIELFEMHWESSIPLERYPAVGLGINGERWRA